MENSGVRQGKGRNRSRGLCKYKDRCSNPSCEFRHPKTETVQNTEQSSSSSNSHYHENSSNFSGATSKSNDQLPLMSINFFDTFPHGAPNNLTKSNSKLDISKKQNIPKKIEPRLCRYGDKCNTVNCRFSHSADKQFHAEREAEVLSILSNRILEIKDQNNYMIASDDENTSEEENYIRIESLKALQHQITNLGMQVDVYISIKERTKRELGGNDEELGNQIEREIFRLESCLPVFSKRLELDRIIESNPRVVIIQGQTGSGKSTQVPQYVADHPYFYEQRVICTQPRKIAAEALANRVAFEYSGGSKVYTPGYHVGYHVGGRKVAGAKCRIEFVTEGIMLEKIMRNDPNLFKNVGCIIIDEAHERSITCDILLGCFKKPDPRWRDILIIVMSATIDLDLFTNYFPGAPVMDIEGRTFPVKTIYDPLPENCDIRNAVCRNAVAIHRSCGRETGDILCFLPGQEDVISAKAQFERDVSHIKNSREFLDVKVLALFGKQDPEQQALVFEKLPRITRKVIFSTDLAETSVTIDGVKFVVDSGVKKEVVYDPKRNISSLKVNTISKSSAIQRAGRSGRTQPGICHRLYSEDDFEKMCVNTAPEIFRKQLSLAVLTLREMEIDPVEFDWISAPSKEALAAAELELKMLKAIDSENRSTELGKLISTSQQDPKLVRMIYAGCKDGFY